MTLLLSQVMFEALYPEKTTPHIRLSISRTFSISISCTFTSRGVDHQARLLCFQLKMARPSMPHTVLTFLHVQMVFRRTQQFSRSQRGNPFKNEIGTHEQTTM